jgi:hypothetical protein
MRWRDYGCRAHEEFLVLCAWWRDHGCAVERGSSECRTEVGHVVKHNSRFRIFDTLSRFATAIPMSSRISEADVLLLAVRTALLGVRTKNASSLNLVETSIYGMLAAKLH